MHLNHVCRKAAGDDGNDSDEEAKRGKMVIVHFLILVLKPHVLIS